ncbi:MAG TPA: 2-C-methyl-D-erythritol 2,4-cyclodiphosphate synthase [Gammaproteobacteria bacterium]|nr:2-C-methyl-D-erythritol 2,4-cyclodiphosphate synthase [Gammaproteobacteria bacterium]
MRIGHGYDVHAFDLETAGSDGLVLGGVKIAHPHSLKAHSDGDVVIHALVDALLGAAGLGDIGQLFPDNDPAYRNMDSRFFLQETVQRLQGKFMQAHNIDITIIAETPRMAEHIDAMRQVLATDLGIDSSQVNVKATTTEKLGCIGRGEGIAVHAVVLLDENG